MKNPTLTDLVNSLALTGAYAINSLGRIVGASGNGDKSRSFSWPPSAPNSSSGTMLEITLLPGERNKSTARSIKDAGQAVGYSLGHTYLCTPSAPNGSTGEAVDLSGLPDGLDASRAFGINAFGRVVGISYGMRANTRSSGRRRRLRAAAR